MLTNFWIPTLIQFCLNLFYTIVALFVAILALKFIDHRLLKTINIEEELRKGNMAVALFVSTLLIFVALIVTMGLKG